MKPIEPTTCYDLDLPQETLTWGDAIRTYFSILFGVTLLVLTFYYQLPKLH